MAVNREKPHLLILPEDDADRQLANGFELEVGKRQLQVEPIAGGWRHAVDQFLRDIQPSMDRYPGRHVVILIDFDEKVAGNYVDRLKRINETIHEHLRDRVFIIGSRKDPEQLKRNLGNSSLEQIGRNLAGDCRQGTRNLWSCDDLAHNAQELDRLCSAVKEILFDTAS